MTKIYKLIFANIFVLICIICLIEISTRSYLTIDSCLNHKCDLNYMIKFKIDDISKNKFVNNLGLTEYDILLGYRPKPGFDKIINNQNYKNKKVTINSYAFRSNDNGELDGNYEILAVGDSFTFGDQVSNDETWPSCLERKLNKKVANAGVFGYGAAQSILRAWKVTGEIKPNTVILGVSVMDNFDRDRLLFRGGFPRPAVIRLGEELSWADAPYKNEIGSKYGKSDLNLYRRIILKLYEYSVVSNIVIKNFLNLGALEGNSRTQVHENAATTIDIIEFSLFHFKNSINAKNKTLLLQYSYLDIFLKDKVLLAKRNHILKMAKKYQIDVIDTFDIFKKEHLMNNGKKIWNGHHTSFGNNLVCNKIYDLLNNIYL